MQDSHRVRNVYNLFILRNLGDEVTVNQVVRNRHANAKDQAIVVCLEHWFHVSFGLAVERSVEIWFVFLSESFA